MDRFLPLDLLHQYRTVFGTINKLVRFDWVITGLHILTLDSKKKSNAVIES
jgi:hypothetical protein